MQDSTNLFTETAKLVGHIETHSGGVLLVDSNWEGSLPATTDDRVCLDLDVGVGKIPVYAVKHAGRRVLLIQVDDIKHLSRQETVPVTDPVEIDLPKQNEEEEEEEAPE